MRFRDEDRAPVIIAIGFVLGMLIFGLVLGSAIRYAGRQVGRGICRSGAGGENVVGVPCP
ncbi:MAG TPA: hypothetical protein VNP73_02105 [Actinomycetota bacterium]|nr:hypothetical protein [Actinomycetota bacterium]